METKKCPHCGADNNAEDTLCATCGQSMSALPSAPQSTWGDHPIQEPPSTQMNWNDPAAQPYHQDKNISGFHRGYATTLKVVTYIFAFGFPLLMFLALCASARGRDAGAQIMLGFFGCGLMAFFLWLYGAFAAKLFDLVSKIAMFNDQILRELRAMKGENDK